MCRPRAFREITGHGSKKEVQSDLKQQIIRSLLGCCLIKDQFSQIYWLVLIRCFNEIQMGKAREDDSRRAEE